MRSSELSIVRIGNSKGIRLPAETLKRYQIEKVVVMEERADEIVLHPKRSKNKKLSWKETFQAMAQAKEDWTDWESALGDGLDDT